MEYRRERSFNSEKTLSQVWRIKQAKLKFHYQISNLLTQNLKAIPTWDRTTQGAA
jgi:hypothetical protein